MKLNILIVKETRASEQRVALVPRDIQELVIRGYAVFLEHGAGIGAGYSDDDYQNAGAIIRYLNDDKLASYKQLFENIDIILRVKRPERSREILENSVISSGTIMIGALDPLEKNSSHMDEYRNANIIAHSFDQLNLSPHDPMNILATMSKIAGRLALQDAIRYFKSSIKKVVIIGFGTAGHAAFEEALQQNLPALVILTSSEEAKKIEAQGGKSVILNKNEDIKQQQQIVKSILLDADIVITTARRANQPAPLLIPKDTLQCMQSGSVIVDMALSEGGNVEGSEHDKTLLLGNQIVVTNISGYPKAVPREASQFWSTATLHFVLSLENGKNILLEF